MSAGTGAVHYPEARVTLKLADWVRVTAAIKYAVSVAAETGGLDSEALRKLDRVGNEIARQASVAP